MVFVKLIGGKFCKFFTTFLALYTHFFTLSYYFTKTIALEKQHYYLVFPALIRTFAHRTTKTNRK